MAQDWTNFKNHVVEGDSRLIPAPSATENNKVLKVVNGSASWQDESGGTITDVKVNNSSVVTSGVANIGLASSSAYGVVKVDGGTIEATDGVVGVKSGVYAQVATTIAGYGITDCAINASTNAISIGGITVTPATPTSPAITSRTMMVPLGGGVWEMTDANYGFVVQNGVVTYLAASKTSFSQYEYQRTSGLTYVYATNILSVETAAFAWCTSLSSLSLPSAEEIEEGSFSDCSSLSLVFLPSVTAIGNTAFSNCTSLSSLSLPSAEEIGSHAFWGTQITTLILSSLTVAQVTAGASDWELPSGCIVTCSDGTYTVP